MWRNCQKRNPGREQRPLRGDHHTEPISGPGIRCEPIGICDYNPHCGLESSARTENLAMTSSSTKTTNHISRAQHKSPRKGERGVTIFIVAVGMVSLLAMAVLAIDIVTLYVAS